MVCGNDLIELMVGLQGINGFNGFIGNELMAPKNTNPKMVVCGALQMYVFGGPPVGPAGDPY